jgi:hypothetical protein
VLRLLTVVFVALLAGFLPGLDREALARGPQPERGSAPQPLRPDPAPGVQATTTVSSGSATARHRLSSPPATAPSHTTVSSSVKPALPTFSPPARTRATKVSRPVKKVSRPVTKVPRAAVHKQKSDRSLSPAALRFGGALPAFLLGRSSKSPIGAQQVTESAQPGRTFLLAGGLALVVLVLGETTLLMLVRTRIGVRRLEA